MKIYLISIFPPMNVKSSLKWMLIQEHKASQGNTYLLL